MNDLVPNQTREMLIMAERLGIRLFDAKPLLATRKNVESRNHMILTNAEVLSEKDHTHYPRSFTQVEAKLLKQKDKLYVFNFNLALNPPQGFTKEQILGRMLFTAKLLRKYKVSVSIASFATSEWELRGEYELQQFLVWLGYNPKEAKIAINNTKRFLDDNKT